MNDTSGHNYLSGPRILPQPIRAGMRVDEVLDAACLAYNGGRLQMAARLMSEKVLEPDVTVGLSLAGALSPAGMTLSTTSMSLLDRTIRSNISRGCSGAAGNTNGSSAIVVSVVVVQACTNNAPRMINNCG